MDEERDKNMSAVLKAKIENFKKLNADNRKELIKELAVRAIKRNEKAYRRLSKD